MLRRFSKAAIKLIIVVLAAVYASAVEAQRPTTTAPWVSAAVGAGGNWITQGQLPSLKGTPQAFASLALTVPHGRWRAEFDGMVSRQFLEAIASHCGGAGPPRCFASGFNVSAASVAIVTTTHDSLYVGSNIIGLGAGLY